MENYFENREYRCLVENERFLSHQLYMTMCGVESCRPGKGFGPIDREGYHLHVILSGRGTFNVEGRTALLHAGQMFMEKPGETTCYYADAGDPWSYCWMTFAGEFAPTISAAAGFSDGVNVIACHVDPMRFYMLADRVLSHPERSLSGSLLRLSWMNEYLALAVESAALTSDGQNRQHFYARDGRACIEHATEYIRRNYASISVMDVAANLGISRSHLTRLFKSNLGCSPGEYLMHIRMERGAWLLANTPMTVQEISGIIGYEDQLTFSKAFKKLYDVSPKYYREMAPGERKVLKAIAQNQKEDGDTEA